MRKRRPPISTRTATLLPDTTLFRSRDPLARLACNQRRGAAPALKTLAGQIPLQPIAARTGFVDEHNPTRLALHTRAEPVDVAVQDADITQAPDLAEPDRVRHHDRVLVNIHSHIDGAIV